jgi:hypothetical protein
LRRRLIVKYTPADSAAHGSYSSHTDETVNVFEGEFEYTIEDLDAYVQVKCGGYSRLAYRDPSGSLAVGDLCLVPLGWHDKLTNAKVIGLGRGSYSGHCKDVHSRLVPEAL